MKCTRFPSYLFLTYEKWNLFMYLHYHYLLKKQYYISEIYVIYTTPLRQIPESPQNFWNFGKTTESIDISSLFAWSIKRSQKDTAIQIRTPVHPFCTSERQFKSSISLFTEKAQSCQGKKACNLFSAYQTQQLTGIRRSPLSKNDMQSDILL